MNTHDINIRQTCAAFCRVSDINLCKCQYEKLGVSADTRLYTEDEVRAAIEADRQRRGEAAFYVNARIFDPATGKIKTDVNGALTWSEKPAGNWQVPVYAAPQPAEPVKARSEKEWQHDIANQSLDRLGVPRSEGEDLLTLWGRIVAAFTAHGLRINEPLTGPYTVETAEPVKVPSNNDILGLASKYNLEHPIRVLRFARALLAGYRNSDIGQSAAQTTASAEPFGHVWRASDTTAVIKLVGDQLIRDGMPVYATPVAAQPSDTTLADALTNLEHDNYEQSYSGYKNRQADLELIRAALAATGDPVKVAADQVAANLAGWLSAALEDPNTCQEMKDDILAWMEAGYPNARRAEGVNQ